MPYAENIIGYYPFNDQTIEDRSGNAHDLTETNDSPGLNFADEFIDKGFVTESYSELDNLVSLSFWFNALATEGTALPFLFFGTDFAPTLFLAFDAANLSNVKITFGVAGNLTQVSIGAITEPVHISCVVDGTNILIYKNGVVVGTLIQALASGALTNKAMIFQIQSTAAKANITQFVVHSRALTSIEVGELFSLGFETDLALQAEIDTFGQYLESLVAAYVGSLADVEYTDTISEDMGTVTGRKIKIVPLSYATNEPVDRATDSYDVRIGVIVYERYIPPSPAERAIPLSWSRTRKMFVESIFNLLSDARKAYGDNEDYWSQTADVTIVYDYAKFDSNKLFWSEMELTFRKLVPVSPANI